MDTLEFRKLCGIKIKQRRLNLGITQKTLGYLVDAKAGYIKNIEAGRQAVSITKISEIFNKLRIDFKISFEERK